MKKLHGIGLCILQKLVMYSVFNARCSASKSHCLQVGLVTGKTVSVELLNMRVVKTIRSQLLLEV